MFLCPCVQHCSNIDACLIGPCQILFEGFVQTNERLFPHVSLLFNGRVDHLLGGVHQRQQGALKIILLQVTGMIWKVRDEPIYVCQLPGNDLLADDFQVSRLEEGSQLGVSHWELPTVLKVYASQQDLVDGKEGQRHAHYWGLFAGFALQTDIFVSPRIIGEHHQRSLGRWGSPQFPIPFLFCLQLEIGLLSKERQTVRQIPEQTFPFIISSHFCLVIYCCGTKGKAEKQALNSAMKYKLRWGADVLAHVGQRLTRLAPRYSAVSLRYAHRALKCWPLWPYRWLLSAGDETWRWTSKAAEESKAEQHPDYTTGSRWLWRALYWLRISASLFTAFHRLRWFRAGC